MKVSELAALLENYSGDAEVLIQTDDGYEHEFRAELRPEKFDGFDTVYPEGLDLIMTD